MDMQQSMGFFGTIWAIIKFIFTWKGALTITLLILLIASIGSIYKSIQEKSFEPVFKEIGGRLLNYENKLYISASKIEKEGGIKIEGDGFIGKTNYLVYLSKIFFDFFGALWILYTIMLIFYKIAIFFSNYQPLVAGIIVLIVFISFEMIGSFIIIGEELVITDDISPIEKHLPLRGVIKTLVIIPYILNPIYENLSIIEGG